MAEIGKRAVVKVSMIGKIKTVVQMIALLILISQPTGITPWVMIGMAGIYLAVILTLWSMLAYLHAAWKILRNIPNL
jgi:CDP-diacylglycerol--glycerol-3-phosphate 3-phosphatidyltransferase